jgi:YidC/Oxa1 family membrane protein insertase
VEKRLFLFVVLSILIWGGFIGLKHFIDPPPPPQQAQRDPAKVENKQADQKAAKEQQLPDREPLVPGEVVPGEVEPRQERPAVPRQRFTLGSLDPNSGYSMLVTFDNRGAAIERIEFSDHYHDLDDKSGYLGHLALTDASRNDGGPGARINIVGPGTPAAIAGLRPGDIIRQINGAAVSQAADVGEYLLGNTRFGDEVSITVRRTVGTQTEDVAVTVKTIRRPLELIRPESNHGALAIDGSPLTDPVGPPSYRMTLAQVGETAIAARSREIEALPSLYDAVWEASVDEAAGQITFTTALSREELADVDSDASLAITKTFQLARKAEGAAQSPYHLAFEVAIKNEGNSAEQVAYRLEGPNGLPLEGWWYNTKVHPGWWAGAGARDVAVYGQGHNLIGNPLLVSHSAAELKKNNPPTYDLFVGMKDARDLGYVAVDAQYFASALLPGNVLDRENGRATFAAQSAFAMPLNLLQDRKWAKTTNVSFMVDSPVHEIGPGETLRSDYVIFAGPKHPDVLAAYQLDPLIEYGWFGWVAKPLRFILEKLYYVVKNFGVAIILLTVMVRLCLLPLGIRQARSAAKMQELQPEMAKIKEKYKDDMEKQAVAQRELFAKHGFNPLGGCLLMVFQLPIFIGLYRCLATDIDLREASLIPGIDWASNLAAPDQLFRWKEFVFSAIGDEAHGWLGPFFNVLPLITVALFMVQQKLFAPPAVTEEAKMQQKVMNFMTIFMGVLFYKVPAGLCIYFITSSLWGIAERKFLVKSKPKTDAAPPEPPVAEKKVEKAETKAKPEKKESRAVSAFNNLLNMADAQLKGAKNTPSQRKKPKK